ncbi:SRPBCC family protein [Pendulispora brunnea]|uniref:SRPBCC family protein n=1 Tax=Pendulispora brunnea TaxID=2905690 RepID=A0ABZ2K631_9BACT
MNATANESGVFVGKLNGINQEFTRFTSRVFPYPIEEVWPHISKSYLELQQFIHASQETASPVKLVSGGDGVGSVIEFDWNGQQVLEKLVEQDDHDYVWSIIVPGETQVFKRYSAKLAFVPITETDDSPGNTLATLELKMVLQKPETAAQIFSHVDPLILQRLPRLEEFIQQKHGYQTAQLAEEVQVPADRLWSIISNWNDISWVLDGQSVKIDAKDPYLREIRFKAGYSISERLVSKDDDSRTLEYQILKGSFPVSYYKGRIHLEPRGNEKSAFRYDLLFIPTGNKEESAKAILDRLKAGVKFINSALGGRAS